MNIAKALNVVCQELGIKQSDICEKTGISDAHMSQIFTGKIMNPKAEMMYRISKSIGLKLDDIMELADTFDD